MTLFTGQNAACRRLQRQAIETDQLFRSQAGLTLFVLRSKYLRWVKGFPDGLCDPFQKLNGVCDESSKKRSWASPIVFVPRTLWRTWGTRRLPLRLLRPMGWKVERRGIPHLAKNERDMGHPRFLVGLGLPDVGHPSIAFEVVTTGGMEGGASWYPTSREKRARCGAPQDSW